MFGSYSSDLSHSEGFKARKNGIDERMTQIEEVDSKQVQDLLNAIRDSLYSASTVAKIWAVASQFIEKPAESAPSYSFGRYTYDIKEEWISGFMPGSLYALLERAIEHPDFYPDKTVSVDKLKVAAQAWTTYLKPQVTRTNTHDLGFIIQPAFRREYKLFGTEKAYEGLVTAANSLSKRFNYKVGCIKSWNMTANKRYSFSDSNDDFIVIIDNLMNIDMLFWAASKSGDLRLSSIAFKHAETTLENHLRGDFSSYHVVVYDANTGKVRAKVTAQGYQDESIWSRGQAWALTGFADTYWWTKDERFLDAAIKASQIFYDNLGSDKVPAWDFSAPPSQIKDTSAGMIAVKGLLRLYECTKDVKFLVQGLEILKGTIDNYLTEEATFNEDGTVNLGEHDTILTGATQMNNEDAFHKIHSHGLVYADYYFLEIGNTLLDLGLY